MSENKNIEAKESFIFYLNNEIDQIREEIKMPGWTNWAILAALASTGWLIILEFEKNVFNLEQIYLLYIVLSLSYTILREFYVFLRPNQPNKKIRFLTTDIIFEEKRLEIFINVIQAFLVVILLMRFSTQVGIIPYYLSLLHYGMIILAPVLILIIKKSIKIFMHTNFYIPDVSSPYSIPFNIPSFSKKASGILKSVMATPPILLDIGILYISVMYFSLYFNLYGITISPTTFSSIKIAILAFSVFPLLKVWIHNEQTSPTLKELVEIRRDLMFENISLDMGKKLTEISISGLNKSAIIQREIANCIVTLQGIDTELNKAAQKNQIASSQLISKKDDENIEAQQALWETIRDATLVHLRQARKIYLSDKSLGGGLINFMKIYAPIEPDDISFIESVQKMAELYREVKKKYDKTIYEWLSLIIKLEGNPPRKKWKDIATKELAAELPNQSILEQEPG